MTRLVNASNVKETDKLANGHQNNVKVVVRVRPLNSKEAQASKSIVKVIDKKMLTFDPKEDSIDCMMSNRNVRTSILDKKQKDINYIFDYVFDGSSSNKSVFENTTKEIINDVLKGYNCSVFAYGATSAGKTHTMLGSPQEPGVIFLTMMELYKKLMEKEEHFETDISVSYLEIYNETCKDLLLPTGALSVQEDPNKKVIVNGLSLHKPRSPEELLDMLHYGNQNRTQHPTDANKQSSRSHAVFQVFVKQCPRDAGIKADIIYAKISLIDLAGSERATVTTNRGDRLREGANINKSLLALGNCINALAENKSNVHIPYRNSKLTRLLKDSLGGNCKTVMIAAVSPSSLSHEDTHNTLKYANRAKNIKSSLHSNVASVDYHVSQYAQIVKELQSQVALLKEKLSKYKSSSDSLISSDDFNMLTEFEKDLCVLYKEKCKFKQDLIEIEGMQKSLQLKMLEKERYHERFCEIQQYLGCHSTENGTAVIERLRVATNIKISKLREQMVMLQSSLEINQDRITNLHCKVDAWANTKSDAVRSYVNHVYSNKTLELQKLYKACQLKQICKFTKMAQAERDSMNRLMEGLCNIITSENSDQQLIPRLLQCIIQHKERNFESVSKVSWAEDSFESKEHSYAESANKFLDFQCITPFKTPSRKPSALRELVMSARKVSATIETSEEREILTRQNTLRNAGPVRNYESCINQRTQSLSSLASSGGKENIKSHRNRSLSSTDQSPCEDMAFFYESMQKGDKRKPARKLEYNHVENEKDVKSCIEASEEFVNDENNIFDSTYLVGGTLKAIEKENKGSIERIKSNIPMRAPLKLKNRETPPSFSHNNSPNLCENYRNLNKTFEVSGGNNLDKTFEISVERKNSPGFAKGLAPVRIKQATLMKEYGVVRPTKKTRNLIRNSIGPSKFFR